ncbi:MAG: 4-alpha-glucanotransferase [Pyrinomonadaceae bacterium]
MHRVGDFQAIRDQLGELPIIAEDLGVITPDVEALRDDFEFPGMRILQFAFGGDPRSQDLPHNYVSNAVVYTGTHDNDTTIGWFTSTSGAGSTRDETQIRKRASLLPHLSELRRSRNQLGFDSRHLRFGGGHRRSCRCRM